jgi:hypothetical protein
MSDFTPQQAFDLGFREMLAGEFGRTWLDDQDLNEAYDEGGNAAEKVMQA